MYFSFRFLVSGFPSKESNNVIEYPIVCHKGPNSSKPDCLVSNQKRDMFQKEVETVMSSDKE